MATFLELLHEDGTTTQITTAEFVRPTVRTSGVSLEDMKLEESEEPQVEPEEQSVSDLIQRTFAIQPTNILGESYFCHHQWQALFWF